MALVKEEEGQGDAQPGAAATTTVLGETDEAQHDDLGALGSGAPVVVVDNTPARKRGAANVQQAVIGQTAGPRAPPRKRWAAGELV